MMKRLLLLMPLLMAFPAHAEISSEVKATCMEAKDFIGCVQSLAPESDLDSLRKIMKDYSLSILSLSSSGRDINENKLIDLISKLSDKEKESLAAKASMLSINLTRIIRRAINEQERTSYGPAPDGQSLSSCDAAQEANAFFNKAVGSQVVSFKISGRAWSGVHFCKEYSVNALIRSMKVFTGGLLDEASVSPQIVEKYEADRAEKYRLANMSAWERHLDKNPGMKQWAAANPAMAATEQAKFNNKNPQKEVQIPSYAETLRFLSKLNPPL